MIFDIRFKWEASGNIGMGDYAGWNVDSSGYGDGGGGGGGYGEGNGHGDGDGSGDGEGDGDGFGDGFGNGFGGWHMIGDGLSPTIEEFK